MFGIGGNLPFPDPLGNSAPDPMGGMNLLGGGGGTEIAPVRIVNTNALDVRVLNFPGVPPPLPGLRPGATPPALPKAPGPKKAPGIGLDTFGLGGIAKMATAAGAIGAVVAGLGELKSTFVDPLLGAAKGGFDSGVGKGAGTEALGKSFEVLGTAVGLVMLPAVLKVSAAAMTLAGIFDQWADSKAGRVMGTSGLDVAGQLAGGKPGEGSLTSVERLREKGIGLIEKNPFFGKAYGKYVDKTGMRPDVSATAKAEDSNLRDLMQMMRNSVGGMASRMGVADVRDQAQQAALQQDPIEAKLKQMLLTKLENFDKSLTNIDKHVAPPGGGST